MDIATHLASRRLLLTEGSVYERLRRDPSMEMDPYIYHAALIYDDAMRQALSRLHHEYLDIGQSRGVAMLAFTDTWRASTERIARSRFAGLPVNRDHATFLRDLRAGYGPDASPIYIAGNIGPRGDAYKPEEALSAEDAKRFHAPQIDALAEGGVDCLFVSTVPAVSEALGIAHAMAATGLPYIVSFVLRPDGDILDGTGLAAAIERIDAETATAPSGYSVNCVYPTAFVRSLRKLNDEAPERARRMLSFQANASARDPAELDNLDHLDSGDPQELAWLMHGLYREFGIPVLGGCCGTDTRHIAALGETILGGAPPRS